MQIKKQIENKLQQQQHQKQTMTCRQNQRGRHTDTVTAAVKNPTKYSNEQHVRSNRCQSFKLIFVWMNNKNGRANRLSG